MADAIAPDFVGVLCAGLYSSASTWAFNVTAELMRGQGEDAVVSLYADELDTRTAEALLSSPRFVIKSHIPGPSLQALCGIANLPIVMTVRDPCDAIASLMLRFGQDFEPALHAVAQSSERLLALQERGKPLLLRYDPGLTANGATIESIARHLGIAVGAADVATLLGEFSASAVARRIADLMSRGLLHTGNPLLECEAATQWHPFHVGDGLAGKSKEILSVEQIAAVRRATERFCGVHGYPITDREPGPMVGWVDDFVPPDIVEGWAGDDLLEPSLEVIALLKGRCVGSCVADLYRADLQSIGDRFRGFHLRLERPFKLKEVVEQMQFRALRGDQDLGLVRITDQILQRAARSSRTGKKT